MSNNRNGFVENKEFKRIDFRTESLAVEYADCLFENCHFQEVDLSGISFDNCRFEGCDLSLAKVRDTAFREIRFSNCKLLGIRFEYGNTFGLSLDFTGCLLNFASFFRLKLKETVFKNCQLVETDFAETDLSGAVFDECDLAGATFDHTNLEKADFRTAVNYIIHPESNRIKKAKFSAAGLAGLLTGYGIEIE